MFRYRSIIIRRRLALKCASFSFIRSSEIDAPIDRVFLSLIKIRSLKRIAHIILSIFVLLVGSNEAFAQSELKVSFAANSELEGFDTDQHPEWSERYRSFSNPDSSKTRIAFKSGSINIADSVLMIWTGLSIEQRGKVSITAGDSTYAMSDFDLERDTVLLSLPAMMKSYMVDVQLKGVRIGMLHVRLFTRHEETVILIPLVSMKLNKDSIENFLNRVYNQAQLNITVSIEAKFRYENYNKTLLDNPSPDMDRYTEQMKEIRDAYFQANPNANKSAYYVFVTPGFVQEDLRGYMVRNKAVGFIKLADLEVFNFQLAQELGFGIGGLEQSWENNGPEQGTTNNLMDNAGGINLTRYQWISIHYSCQTIIRFDDYEDVRTNSGIVAFYLWEEDENGNIFHQNNLFLKGITRPFKRNKFSYHLDITNFLFSPLFVVKSYRINSLHFLGFILVAFLVWIGVRRAIRWVRLKKLNFRLIRWTVRLFIVGIFLYFGIFIFDLINSGYSMYQVGSGEIKEFADLSLKEVKNSLMYNSENPIVGEERLASEILVGKDGKWELKKRKNVLYFTTQIINGKIICRHIGDSDSLKISSVNYAEHAESHYMVFNKIDATGKILSQKVFNHLGSDITAQMKLQNPSKRILVFVNGYRPTSLGQSFEENFSDIQKNGLEFPNSSNMIYDFDRYGYWRWREIDGMFENRINPEETYYADGHFSVSTSNHGSLVGFTTLAGSYPHRCKNEDNHVCKDKGSGFLGFGSDKTVTLFNLEPNTNGFNERKLNGRTAGRNLFQMFNELPNKSDNDTLFIVAHSMGYAYALGVIEELRGKIEFGGLYIIAPENASSGIVRKDEWNEVWQYGSNFEKYKYRAPCLLDGIAPQTQVGGLSKKFRVFFPASTYKRKGFFDSHFIGNYTWIFKLEKDENGYIYQR